MRNDVRLEKITKRFGQVTAVNALDITINEGECFSMLGPSGCGKTTTLRMLAGFEDIDEGEIRVGDRIFSSKARNYYLPPEKRDFGMVFQAFAVWPHLTVFDNVAFPLQIRGMPKHEIAEKTKRALAYTNLMTVENSYPNELSGGAKQRIALARAIAINPTVMLLDEPLSNLDPKLREEMRFEIKDLQRKLGFTIVFVTHDQAEAMALSDRILVMRDGVVQQIDAPLTVYDKPSNRFVFSFIGLSNFIPVEITDNKVYVKGQGQAGEIRVGLPAASAFKKPVLAFRPSDVQMGDDGEVRGIVTRRAYLGDIVDYRIMAGDVEVRVQSGARRSHYQVGDSCSLSVGKYHWYEED
ncbi:MAG: ABC transporter ATP-binding protein [Desulfuromonadales bacterium]